MKTRKDNIILTGLPASGKTSVGRVISEKTGMKFIDLDFLIEENEKMKISSIFQKFGESYFRNLETHNLNKLLEVKEPFILSTGGGTVVNNGEILSKLGVVFYLEIAPEAAYSRIENDKTRPLLQKANPKKAIREIYERRKKFYETADFRINAELTLNEIADRIIYEKNNSSNQK